MNLKELKEMVELMNDNGLTELEVEQEGTKIKLKRSPDGSLGVQPMAYHMPHIPQMPPQVAGAPVAPLAAEEVALNNFKAIESPMVGTFYRAPSPEATPFAEIGQVVEVGQVVCIVEAMKLMNEIKSEVRGKIVEICVDNAEPVEFGQALFRIDPAQ